MCGINASEFLLAANFEYIVESSNLCAISSNVEVLWCL